jgi:hypothetical protein
VAAQALVIEQEQRQAETDAANQQVSRVGDRVACSRLAGGLLTEGLQRRFESKSIGWHGAYCR